MKNYLKGIVKTEKGSGKFSVLASTASIDRQGESIDQKGWDISNFQKNPVMLWAHNYNELPVGVAESVTIDERGLSIVGRFASPEANPKAEQVRLLYEDEILQAVSVGFIPKERDGTTITKAELLEVSFVPVPANPEALAFALSKGFDPDFFKHGGEALVDNPVGDANPEPQPEPEAQPEPAPEPAPEPSSEPVPQPEPQPEPEVKSGRVLSKKTRGMIEEAVTSLENSVVALRTLLTGVDTPDTEEDAEARAVEIPMELFWELRAHQRQAGRQNELTAAILKRVLSGK